MEIKRSIYFRARAHRFREPADFSVILGGDHRGSDRKETTGRTYSEKKKKKKDRKDNERFCIIKRFKRDAVVAPG